jgi:hypothetical protein
VLANEERQAGQVLSGILKGLYRRAAGDRNALALPIKIIDKPDVANAIFLAPDVFVKNYGFLETFAKARFSANGDEWKLRAALTQPYYNRAFQRIGGEGLQQIYRQHLLDYAAGKKSSIFQTFLDAAISVISRSFGLEEDIPWPEVVVERIRRGLKIQQALAWLPQNPIVFARVAAELQDDACALGELWQAHAGTRNLMASIESQAEGIPSFDAAQELLQIMLAASETVASSMLWLIEGLGRWPQVQAKLRAGGPADLELYIKETLRLFPTLPMVTRVCSRATTVAGVEFKNQESVLVSIVGLHCNPDCWIKPMEFHFPRQEFVDDSYNKAAFVPFITGPRVCGGMRLAQAELNAALPVFLDLFQATSIATPLDFEYGLASRPVGALEPHISRNSR